MGDILFDNTTKPAERSKIARLSSLPDPVKENYNKVKFGQLVRDMKGRYSSREYAARTGLSESFISKAISGSIDNPPSKRTMLKLGRAVSEVHVPIEELLEAAGYPVGQDGERDDGSLDLNKADDKRSMSAAISEYYGGDLRSAKYEFERALTDKAIKGAVSTWMDGDAGYFTVTDEEDGQIFVGIPAYCGFQDGSAAVAFASALLYDRLAREPEARNQIFYILCDNDEIYKELFMMKRNEMPLATVLLYTDDHRSFKHESLLEGSNFEPEKIAEA